MSTTTFTVDEYVRCMSSSFVDIRINVMNHASFVSCVHTLQMCNDLIRDDVLDSVFGLMCLNHKRTRFKRQEPTSTGVWHETSHDRGVYVDDFTEIMLPEYQKLVESDKYQSYVNNYTTILPTYQKLVESNENREYIHRPVFLTYDKIKDDLSKTIRKDFVCSIVRCQEGCYVVLIKNILTQKAWYMLCGKPDSPRLSGDIKWAFYYVYDLDTHDICKFDDGLIHIFKYYSESGINGGGRGTWGSQEGVYFVDHETQIRCWCCCNV